MKSIEAYGYIVTGPDYWIDEIEEALENRAIRWNWFLFENGDAVYDNNGNLVGLVKVSHDLKTIVVYED